MRAGKLLLAILAILLVTIIVPSTIPKSYADDQNETLNTSGYIFRHNYDSFYGDTVDAVQSGSALTFSLTFVADNFRNFQRNITMGVKFDWSNHFENTSASTPVLMGQTNFITLTYTMPALTGQYANLNLTPHSWTVEVWDMALGAVWTNNCNFDNGFQSCRTFDNGYSLAIYSSAQATSMLTAQQAAAEISALGNILSNSKQAPPGTSSAIAALATAEEQLTIGETAYQTGNFATAQTDFQNALNSANAANSALATTGGGTDTATLTSIWLVAVAGLLGGIGALLLGFGGFNYLRRRARSPTSYVPAPDTKP